MPVTYQSQDLRKAEPQPPVPEQRQSPPESEAALESTADHGEKSYTGFGRLKGKAAIITGGDSGIGRAVAIAFAREGADVLFSYLNEHEDAKETARSVRESGRKVILEPGAIGSREQWRRLIDRAMGDFGKLDIVVNNAACQMSHEKLDEVTEEELEHTFRTSTKGAIVTFTKGLAALAGERGVRVNAVAPMYVFSRAANRLTSRAMSSAWQGARARLNSEQRRPGGHDLRLRSSERAALATTEKYVETKRPEFVHRGGFVYARCAI